MYLTADDLNDTLISTIPKCGSQSISRVLGQKRTHIYVNTEDSINYATRVMFLRHPDKRIESCWSFFRHKRLDNYPLKQHLPVDVIQGHPDRCQEEYEGFVDYFLENDNNHWASQIDLLTTKSGIFTPTIIHKFEDIQLHWEKYAVGELPWENAFSKVLHEPYRVADITEKYAADLALWESL